MREVRHVPWRDPPKLYVRKSIDIIEAVLSFDQLGSIIWIEKVSSKELKVNKKTLKITVEEV